MGPDNPGFLPGDDPPVNVWQHKGRGSYRAKRISSRHMRGLRAKLEDSRASIAAGIATHRIVCRSQHDAHAKYSLAFKSIQMGQGLHGGHPFWGLPFGQLPGSAIRAG